MFKAYGELSTILYEHTKPPGHSIGGDIEYFADKLHDIKGKVLEAGVGTGRMLIPLIQKGFDVDGVDISPDMLAKCKANLGKYSISADLYQQDLSKLSLPQKYDAIIMPTGSFCLLPRDIIENTLACFLNHLEVGGKLIIDIIFPDEFKKGETFLRTFQLDNEMGILYTSFHSEIDWIEQKASHIIRFDLLKNGEIQKTEVSNFILFWYGIKEIEILLQSVGFAEISHEFGYGAQGQLHPITFTAIKRR
ncbi:MAG: class I SAM-dependent methyltransferase [Defluviitaleaceae bacterium]|nr:class I SAM-dependent methyltransferase [Defluviitaleaceae bacterium]